FSLWQDYGEAYISSITLTELLVGVHRANTEERKVKRSAFVEHVISKIANLAFGEEEARIYAQLLRSMFEQGITLGVHDMLIGATAIARGYPVLTMNTADFRRIPGLEVIEVKAKRRK
ncbi:MAG: type II toxin-antitoxin system VapC family toxin, partial [Alphaproteobacteria bacterium]|nr:type II toxin-antitoxin system VapC family toxin [Alphaproteobacteria bacterium]